jgi:hypothetical protein
MPHLVGDNLILRTLLYETDAGALLPLINIRKQLPLKKYFARSETVGREDGFHLSQ